MSFLPSKKFNMVLAGLLIAAGGVFAVSALFPQHKSAGGDIATKVKEAGSIQFKDTDTDKDGLKDWEEALWGTNPRNPDSDSDGTNDGDEVLAGRNPTIEGPNDSLESNPELLARANGGDTARKTNEEKGNRTLTDRVSRTFIAEYLNAKRSDAHLSDGEQERVLATLQGEFSGMFSGAQKYSLSDVLTTNDTTEEALRTYGNALGSIVLEHSFETENELLLLKRAVEEGDTEAFETIRFIADAYRAMENDFRETPAPRDAREEHRALLNSVATLAHIVEGMEKAETDPLRALLAIQSYEKAVQELQDALAGLGTYFKDNNIRFETDESTQI